jgi:ribosomal protein L24E
MIHCNHCDQPIQEGKEFTDSIGDEIVAYFCSQQCMDLY